MNTTSLPRSFGQILPALFAGLLLGSIAGYFIAKHGLKQYASPFQLEASSAKLEDLNAGSKSGPTPDPFPTNDAAEKLAKLQALPVKNSDANPETGEAITYSAPSNETVSRITEKPSAQGVVQEREIDEKTGEAYTTELMPDGTTANRSYRTDGSLKDERLKLSDGSQLERSFFEAGGTKVANYTHPDGSVTSAAFDSTGVPSELMTNFPDHTTIFNEYDDHGKILKTWRRMPDGTVEPFDEQ